MTILGIDLGKFKSVACSYQSQTASAKRFQTIPTGPSYFERLLEEEKPDLVVIEACSVAGWVYDFLCAAFLGSVDGSRKKENHSVAEKLRT